MILSSSGEVATFVSVSQFETGESAYECVAFSAALCKYMGKPDGRPGGSPEDVDALADNWYASLTGSISPSNKSGMSLDQLHKMLDGVGMRWHNLPTDGDSPHDSVIQNIKNALNAGHPVIICGSETGFHDMDLGDRVPYGWPPSGNHAIVATGIAHDGNLLVRDMANIGPNGLRPGPRSYDVNTMFLVSSTEIIPDWSEEGGDITVSIDLNNGAVAGYFEATHDGKWQCRPNRNTLQGSILNFYRSFGQSAFCGLTYLGLPLSNEIPVDKHPGVVKQQFERVWLVYDPQHQLDQPPGAGEVYLMHMPQ